MERCAEVTVLRRNPPCYLAQKLPCCIGDKHFYAACEDPLQISHHGLVQWACSPGDYKFYVIKFSKIESEQMGNENAVDELFVTQKMSEMVRNNSIQIKHKQYSRHAGIYQWAMVMPFHCHENLADVRFLDDWDYDLLIQYKDEQVIKFLIEMGLVLRTMWSLGYVDRDFRLSNVLITGSLSHPNTTTYVKIDYGSVIKAKDAVSELVTERGRNFCFCHFGYNVKYFPQGRDVV